MAQVKNNLVIQGLSGSLGKQIVIRKGKGGRTIVAARPTFGAERVFNPVQLSHQEAFRQAIAYAKTAKTQEVYINKAQGTPKSAFNVAVADWFKKPEVLEIDINGWSRMHHHNTYCRILVHKVYVEEVERLVGEYNQHGEQGEVYAMDGKAGRGMRKKDEEGHGYCFPVKENQLRLYQNIQQLFAPEYPKPGFGKIQMDFLASQKVSNGYGRLETRILTTSEMLNPYSTWPGLAQVYRLECQFQWWRSERCYRTSNEVEFGITSLSRSNASPARLLMIRRAHWGIETGLHGRRDATFKEDAIRMTVGDTGKVMTSMNNLVIALTRQAKYRSRPTLVCCSYL